MIRSRLSFTRLYLKIVTLLLPACAYFISVKVRFGFNFLFSRTPPAGLPSYWSILLLTTIVWAIAAEESGLWNVEQLYAPGGKSRRLLEAFYTGRPVIRDSSLASAPSPCSSWRRQPVWFSGSFLSCCARTAETKS